MTSLNANSVITVGEDGLVTGVNEEDKNISTFKDRKRKSRWEEEKIPKSKNQ